MALRFLFIYIIIPLAIAIISGAFLYHYPSIVGEKRQLIYRENIFKSPSFAGANYDFYYLTIENNTDKNQNNIDIKLITDGDPSNIEIYASDMRGEYNEYSKSFDDGSVNIILPLLRSGENVSFQFITRNAESAPIRFFIRSDSVIAEKAEIEGSRFRWVSWLIIILVNTPFILLLLAFYFLFFKYRHSWRANVNDTAFVLLHSGQTDKAKKILNNAILNNGGTVYELTNYACCLVIEGNLDEAKSYLNASEILNGGEIHDNIYLVKAILYKATGDDIAALEYFNKFRNYRRLIIINFYKRYQGSVILKDLENAYLKPD